MLEIAVCEDERYQQGELEELLYSLGKKHGIGLEVDVYENGESLLKAIQEKIKYDLVYLDVEMSGINGVEVAEKLRESDRTVQLVYVTHYDGYLKQSTQTMPSGYIIKPVDVEEFEKLFLRISRWIRDKDEYFRFCCDKVPCKVWIRSIVYIKSDRRRVIIVCEEEQVEVYKRLDEVEKELEGSAICFLRIHQSYLVNDIYVKRFGHNWVDLVTGERLPMSRRKRENVEDKLKAI